ncbi:hypothetical protein BG000_010378 [Podila horticola]|nr:hypothetical protein BG000_010378 [Podila horticola]
MDHISPKPNTKPPEQWHPESYTFRFERTILGIDSHSNTIEIDIPMVMTLEPDPDHPDHPPGNIFKLQYKESMISDVGIENMCLDSDHKKNDPDDEDEDHAWYAVVLDNVRNGWVADVTTRHFSGDGRRRYAFNLSGPNAFVESEGDDATNDTGPHERWAMGTLYDNITCNRIDVQNRASMGTGQGWAGAFQVVYNCTAKEESIIRDAPGTNNWVIGFTGRLDDRPEDDDGVIGIKTASTSTDPKMPRSLYWWQLIKRMGGNSALVQQAVEMNHFHIPQATLNANSQYFRSFKIGNPTTITVPYQATQLRHLDISGWIHTRHASNLIRANSHLTELKWAIVSTNMDQTTFSAHLLSALTAPLENLQTLSIEQLKACNTHYFPWLLTGLPSLKHLSIRDCSGIERCDAASFDEPFPNLTILRLGCDWYTNPGLAQLVRFCPNLERLFLNPNANCPVTELSKNLRQCCPRLISIECLDPYEAFKALMEHSATLETLDLYICGDAPENFSNANNLLLACPRLKYFALRNYLLEWNPEAGLAMFAIPWQCRNLEAIVLDGFATLFDAEQISEEGESSLEAEDGEEEIDEDAEHETLDGEQEHESESDLCAIDSAEDYYPSDDRDDYSDGYFDEHGVEEQLGSDVFNILCDAPCQQFSPPEDPELQELQAFLSKEGWEIDEAPTRRVESLTLPHKQALLGAFLKRAAALPKLRIMYLNGFKYIKRSGVK